MDRGLQSRVVAFREEIWFTASKTSEAAALHAVSLSGDAHRLLYRAPALLRVLDISRDGACSSPPIDLVSESWLECEARNRSGISHGSLPLPSATCPRMDPSCCSTSGQSTRPGRSPGSIFGKRTALQRFASVKASPLGSLPIGNGCCRSPSPARWRSFSCQSGLGRPGPCRSRESYRNRRPGFQTGSDCLSRGERRDRTFGCTHWIFGEEAQRRSRPAVCDCRQARPCLRTDNASLDAVRAEPSTPSISRAGKGRMSEASLQGIESFAGLLTVPVCTSSGLAKSLAPSFGLIRPQAIESFGRNWCHPTLPAS